jgi:hypothetical protein
LQHSLERDVGARHFARFGVNEYLKLFFWVFHDRKYSIAAQLRVAASHSTDLSNAQGCRALPEKSHCQRLRVAHLLYVPLEIRLGHGIGKRSDNNT